MNQQLHLFHFNLCKNEVFLLSDLVLENCSYFTIQIMLERQKR